MQPVEMTFLQTGFCTNWEKMVIRKGKWKKIRFPARCALIRHPSFGYILFDTGYSRYVFEEAKEFPMQLYTWTTPITFREKHSLVNQLKAKGISQEEIKLIIISHFHIDHLGGLKDFPKAQVVCTRAAFQSTLGLTPFQRLKKAFMPGLIPADFVKRAKFLEKAVSPMPIPEFELGYDLLGDGSLLAIDLPGHAEGQIGLFLNTPDQMVLLAADACWTSRAFKDYELPHPLAKLIIHDYEAFKATLMKLHKLHASRPDIAIIPTHCEEISWRQNGPF